MRLPTPDSTTWTASTTFEVQREEADDVWRVVGYYARAPTGLDDTHRVVERKTNPATAPVKRRGVA